MTKLPQEDFISVLHSQCLEPHFPSPPPQSSTAGKLSSHRRDLFPGRHSEEVPPPPYISEADKLGRLESVSYTLSPPCGRCHTLFGCPSLLRPLLAGDGLRQDLSRAIYIYSQGLGRLTGGIPDIRTAVEGILSFDVRQP